MLTFSVIPCRDSPVQNPHRGVQPPDAGADLQLPARRHDQDQEDHRADQPEVGPLLKRYLLGMNSATVNYETLRCLVTTDRSHRISNALSFFNKLLLILCLA